jgi:hypothetical protein
MVSVSNRGKVGFSSFLTQVQAALLFETSFGLNFSIKKSLEHLLSVSFSMG